MLLPSDLMINIFLRLHYIINLWLMKNNNNLCIIVIGMSGTGKTTFVNVHPI